MSNAKRFHGRFGCGIALAFFSTCIGIDGPGQFILFAFGFVYSALGDRP